MSLYSGKPVTVARPIDDIYGKISSLDAYADKLNNLPQEAREKIGDVRFENSAIIINTPQVGELRLEITEREAPTRVVLSAIGSPVPAKVVVQLSKISDESTQITPAMDVEIPMMLRPFIGSKLQQAADQFGDLIGRLSL